MRTGARSTTSDFAQFYFGSYPRLYRTVVLLCASRAEAEDVLHEAYSRALGRWDAVSRLDAPEAWVRRVALNQTVDAHRGRARARGAWPRLAANEQTPGPEGSDVPDVVRALQQLPAVQRRIVVLHHLADRSVEDVARELQLPVGTVKSHLFRARARLSELLRIDDEVLNDER